MPVEWSQYEPYKRLLVHLVYCSICLVHPTIDIDYFRPTLQYNLVRIQGAGLLQTNLTMLGSRELTNQPYIQSCQDPGSWQINLTSTLFRILGADKSAPQTYLAPEGTAEKKHHKKQQISQTRPFNFTYPPWKIQGTIYWTSPWKCSRPLKFSHQPGKSRTQKHVFFFNYWLRF